MKTARKHLALAAVLLAAAASTCLAAPKATGIIRGKVTYGKAPVSGVTISLDGDKKTAKTNEKGLYEINEVAPGEYKIEANGIAKNTRRKALAEVLVPEGEKAEVTKDLELK